MPRLAPRTMMANQSGDNNTAICCHVCQVRLSKSGHSTSSSFRYIDFYVGPDTFVAVPLVIVTKNSSFDLQNRIRSTYRGAYTPRWQLATSDAFEFLLSHCFSAFCVETCDRTAGTNDRILSDRRRKNSRWCRICGKGELESAKTNGVLEISSRGWGRGAWSQSQYYPTHNILLL